MDIMFDLETSSSDSHAGILAIGAVAFDIKGPVLIDIPYDTFYVNVELASQPYAHISPSTFYWWLKQDSSAILENRENIYNALTKFSAWFNKVGHGPLWSHASFDPPILEYAYSQNDIKQPFKYTNLFDVRTMKHLAGPVETIQDFPHNALYDALRQAIEVQKCYQRVIKGYLDENFKFRL